jgi:hypothetical protein
MAQLRMLNCHFQNSASLSTRPCGHPCGRSGLVHTPAPFNLSILADATSPDWVQSVPIILIHTSDPHCARSE